MSVGPMGMAGSIAGSQLPQAKGSDVDRAHQETVGQARQASAEEKAESAAGVGQTEEDQQTSDRDADGRRLWEPADRDAGDGSDGAADQPDSTGAARQSRDPHGLRGANLDLSG